METLDNLNQDTILLLKKHNCLNNLVTSVLVEEAINTVKLTQEEYSNIVEQVKISNGIEKDIILEDWLKEKQISEEQFLEAIIQPHKLNKYCLDNFKHKTEARFLSLKDSLDVIVYSLIRVKDIHLAKELYQRISEGEAEFADIATKYSEGPEKLTKGLVGPVGLDKAMGPLKELLKSSKPGELRQPIYLEKWYLLIRLESINHAQLDEQMILRLSKELFYEWINNKVEIQVGKLVNTLPTNENVLVK